MYVLPKRSVTVGSKHIGSIQDLDARRKITTKIKRSRSNYNKNQSQPITVYTVTSFEKKENLAPPLTPRGFFFGRMTVSSSYQGHVEHLLSSILRLGYREIGLSGDWR